MAASGPSRDGQCPQRSLCASAIGLGQVLRPRWARHRSEGGSRTGVSVMDAEALFGSVPVTANSTCEYGVLSFVVACRGFTAGAGHATTELRVMLIRIIDRALCLFPAVTPTLFVDDLSAEATGPEQHVKRNLGGFIDQVATELTADQESVLCVFGVAHVSVTAAMAQVGHSRCKCRHITWSGPFRGIATQHGCSEQEFSRLCET